MNWEIEDIVNEYSKMIFQIAFQNTFIKSVAEDITQEVLIKVWKNIKHIKDDNHLKAWLIRVTINACKDSNRKYDKKEVPLEETEIEYFDKETSEIFEELKKLKPINRNIIYLYYYEGYTIKEISKILKMNANTVSTNLKRARKELKNILEEGGDNYEG